jgi:hypothetical protein
MRRTIMPLAMAIALLLSGAAYAQIQKQAPGGGTLPQGRMEQSRQDLRQDRDRPDQRDQRIQNQGQSLITNQRSAAAATGSPGAVFQDTTRPRRDTMRPPSPVPPVPPPNPAPVPIPVPKDTPKRR